MAAMVDEQVTWPFLPFAVGLLPEAGSGPVSEWRCKRRLGEESVEWSAKRRRHETGKLESKRPGSEVERCHDHRTDLSEFSAFGEFCVADLSTVSFVTLATLVAASVFILVCVSSSLILAAYKSSLERLRLCSCLCLALTMLMLSNHVLFMTYEGAWAI
ncbi:unnamed protein product [Symbiodinium sp. CCMP2592]|nr:unnamed protein product [Symbiodinium sp. CCMP2592]